MADGSGVASFQFISYKIDNVNLNVTKNVGILATNALLQPNETEFTISIRNPCKYLINDAVHYVGGIKVDITIRDRNKEQILKGTFGISGLFRPQCLDGQGEENMVRINIPVILLPYLRSSITTIFSQAGFGTIILPLINIYEIVKNQSVDILDYTKPAGPIRPQ
jgi:preprotein translocase subunit SecB